MAGAIPKPAVMRGLCTRRMKIHSVGILVACIVSPAVYWYGYAAPKKAKYIEHYKNYDPYKAIEAMCKKNLLQSCPQNQANK